MKTNARHLAACAIAAVFGFAACGSDSGGPDAQIVTSGQRGDELTSVTTTTVAVEAPPTSPTPEPSVTEAPPVTEPPTTEPPATTTAPAPTGGTSIEDIAASARAVYGPTTDAVASIAAFIPTPAGIPTPDGADVFAFSVRVDPGSGTELVTSGDVTFSAPGSLADLATFYEASMVAAGYTRTGSGTDTNSQGQPVSTIDFDIPGSDYVAAGVSVRIVDRGDVRTVEIQIDDRPDQAAAAAAEERLDAWASTFPGRGSDVVTNQVTLSVGTVSGAYLELHSVGYGTLAQADQVAAIVAAVPDGTYELDPDLAPTDGAVWLLRAGATEVTATVASGSSLGTLVNVGITLDL